MKNFLTKNKKAILSFAVLCAITIIISSAIVILPKILPEKTPEEKVFNTEAFSLTLTDNFSEEQFDGFNCAFTSKNVAVLVSKEDFSLFSDKEIMTEEEYAQLVISANELSSEIGTTDGGFTCFTYEATSDDTYTYFASTHKSEDAYWLVQFCTPKDKFPEYEEQIRIWTDSFRFNP